MTVCYTALIAHQKCAPGIETVSDARWVALDALDDVDLAFDHRFIITQARERLKQKALYSIVPAYALPEKFTLPELQRIHEVLIGKPLQKKSFRRRIEQAEILVQPRDGSRSYIRLPSLAGSERRSWLRSRATFRSGISPALTANGVRIIFSMLRTTRKNGKMP